MSAAHTPGRDRNWRASAGRSGYGAHDGVTVTDNRGLVVAVAIGDVPELDALATARLIAAAPDLLEAAREGLIRAEADLENELRVCAEWGDAADTDATVAVLRERRDKIAAAIAKATGQ